jgi:hypothetical protein
VDLLVADSSRAKQELGWEPKIRFKDLVKIMVDLDMEARGLTPPGEGRKVLASNATWCDERALVDPRTKGIGI